MLVDGFFESCCFRMWIHFNFPVRIFFFHFVVAKIYAVQKKMRIWVVKSVECILKS
jgi:hypothetical protein